MRVSRLVESMVALLLTVLVLGLVYHLLVAQQRTASSRPSGFSCRPICGAPRPSSPRTCETSPPIPRTSTSSPSLPESVTYRATRGSGIACRIGPTSVELLGETYGAFRRPQPGRDSLLLHVAAGPGREWVSGPVDCRRRHQPAAEPTRCVSPPCSIPVALAAASAGPLFPVRLFEIMQIKLYQSQGNSLARREIGQCWRGHSTGSWPTR